MVVYNSLAYLPCNQSRHPRTEGERKLTETRSRRLAISSPYPSDCPVSSTRRLSGDSPTSACKHIIYLLSRESILVTFTTFRPCKHHWSCNPSHRKGSSMCPWYALVVVSELHVHECLVELRIASLLEVVKIKYSG